ncbi:hypothetical protein OG21DRAFT_1424861, partial [Imleria badia]
TPSHIDSGGAFSFYDHLLSFGHGYFTILELGDLNARFAYSAGICVFLTDRVLKHSVPQWSGGK